MESPFSSGSGRMSRSRHSTGRAVRCPGPLHDLRSDRQTKRDQNSAQRIEFLLRETSGSSPHEEHNRYTIEFEPSRTWFVK